MLFFYWKNNAFRCFLDLRPGGPKISVGEKERLGATAEVSFNGFGGVLGRLGLGRGSGGLGLGFWYPPGGRQHQ